MEIIDENVAMISNFEVYDLLSKSKQRAKGKRHNSKSQNLATISYETTEYLKNTPCAHQNPKVIEEFLKALSPYKLTKAESLQLLNLRPTSAVEIQLIVEEIEERLNDEEVTSLLGVIATVFPSAAGEAMDASTSDKDDSKHTLREH